MMSDHQYSTCLLYTSPYGYEVAEAITFVAGDGKTVTMQDEWIQTDIRIQKIDAKTKEPIIGKAFVFALYSDANCTQLSLYTSRCV